jgi:hypothetical protein
MTLGPGIELAAEARARVARVARLLESPDVAALDRSTAELAGAVALIEQIQREEGQGGAPLKSALDGLRGDLRSVRSLLRQAWEFRMCPGGQPGYNGKGQLALQPPPGGRLALEA